MNAPVIRIDKSKKYRVASPLGMAFLAETENEKEEAFRKMRENSQAINEVINQAIERNRK